jgi:hypothetical protein
MDGVGYSTVTKFEYWPPEEGRLPNSSRMALDLTNYQGFITTALNWNPRNDMLAKFTLGTGFEDTVVDSDLQNNITNSKFSQDFYDKYPYEELKPILDQGQPSYDTREYRQQNDLVINAQVRADYDWELGKDFLVASGVQEMFTRYSKEGDQQGTYEERFTDMEPDEMDTVLRRYPELALLSGQFLDDLRISFPASYSTNAENFLFTTSGYSLVEYTTPGKRFGTELGLRVDHYYLLGDDFSYGTKPVLNPRLNTDFNVFKNLFIFDSLDVSAGTGLFSAVDKTVFMTEERYKSGEVKPNRSWTSVLGTRITFPEGIIFNIEGYYKYIYDRMYVAVKTTPGDKTEIKPEFDGEGRVWGIDLMLRKMQSRNFDGWISYSYSWVKYRDPSNNNADMVISGNPRGNDWYYPDFHRFHNLNLVVNIKPTPQFNLYTRFGLASGTQLPRLTASDPTMFPLLMYDDSGPLKFVQRYEWPSVADENNRMTPAASMDLKFSFFGKNRSGKTRYEIYFALENALALMYTPQGNTRFNPDTGEIDTAADSASYGLPIPIPSFGFVLKY